MLALQQFKSILTDTVTTTDDASADKVKAQDLVGNTAPNEADVRHGDTKYNNPTYDGVWIPQKPELYYADLIDNQDKLATSIELQGTSVQSGAATVERAKDQRILEAFYGNTISGKDGTIVTPFPSAQIVPVTIGGASGPQRMNTAKLRACTKLLLKGYVDAKNTEKYMVLTAEQNDDLLTEVPATNADFQAAFGGVVQDGMLMKLLGWNFVHLELANPLLGQVPVLSLDPSGYRKTPFWAKQGVIANFWNRLRTSIDPVPTKQLSQQVWAGTTLSATRTQAGYSGYVLNSEL
jgi:hypothetical protein